LLQFSGICVTTVCVYDDTERNSRSQMYLKRVQQQNHHHHHHHHRHSISLGTSSVAGRTSPTPTPHGACNPVVLKAPVVQHIRASNGRGTAAGAGGYGGGQSAALGGGVARNEPHPLARLAAAADHDADVTDDATTRNVEASHGIRRSVRHLACLCIAKTVTFRHFPFISL